MDIANFLLTVKPTYLGVATLGVLAFGFFLGKFDEIWEEEGLILLFLRWVITVFVVYLALKIFFRFDPL